MTTDDDRSMPDGYQEDEDDVLRRLLSTSAGAVGETPVDELADLLSDRLGRANGTVGLSDQARMVPPRRRGRRFLVVAALVLAVTGVLGAYVLVGGGRRSGTVNVADGSDVSNGFDDWTPGWHELDRGPVPGFVSASLAWFDGHLIVAGGSWVSDGSDQGSSESVTSQWAFDPDDRSWSELPAPPFVIDSMVVSDGVLVADGFPGDQDGLPRRQRDRRWATLGSIDGPWSDHGVMNRILDEDMRPYLRTSLEGTDILVDTGERVIDFSLWTVLDPATGDSVPLDPLDTADLPPIANLPPLVEPVPLVIEGSSETSVAWPPVPAGAGSSAAATFSDDLLIWDATGQRLERMAVHLADSPSNGAGRDTQQPDGMDRFDAQRPDRWATVAVDGRVMVIGVEGSAIHSAYSIDPVSGAVEPIASIGETIDWSLMDDGEACYFAQSSAGGDVLAMPCGTSDSAAVPLWMHDGEWSIMADLPPRVAAAARVSSWSRLEPAGGSIVIWPTVDRPDFPSETVYVPKASQPWAVVWVPGPHGHDRHPPTPTEDEDAAPGRGADPAPCTVDDLPDVTFALDHRFMTRPRHGIGGLGDDQQPADDDHVGTTATCSRYWIDTGDPGVHMTQYVGGPPGVDGGGGEQVGAFRTYAIHEGFVIEHRPTGGAADWSLVVYGLGEEEVLRIVERLDR